MTTLATLRSDPESMYAAELSIGANLGRVNHREVGMLRLGLMFSGKHPVGNSRMGVNASRKGSEGCHQFMIYYIMAMD